MKLICAALTVALFVGCATEPEKRWYKAGSTEQTFAMDQGQCQAQALGVPGMNGIQVALVYQACMQGKGWESR